MAESALCYQHRQGHYATSYVIGILLYGFGLALTLSLAFNGFLLYEQSRRQDLLYGYAPEPSGNAAVWQQQLSDCAQANEQKDSLILWLERLPSAPPGQSAVVHRRRSD